MGEGKRNLKECVLKDGMCLEYVDMLVKKSNQRGSDYRYRRQERDSMGQDPRKSWIGWDPQLRW